MYNISMLMSHSQDVKEYIESIIEDNTGFMERYNSYVLMNEVVTKIRCHSDKYIIFAFSAEWCPDCVRNIPVLARLQEETELMTRVFGHLVRDAKSSTRLWRIPPSPEEVALFNVVKIPSIYILDKQGNKIGEIIENPPSGKKLEATILEILES